MKHPLKKLASAVLATALLASCMSVGFLASAAGSYVFTDKFGDNKFPKAVSVFVQGGGATDKCYGFTTNAPMVESMPDDREQVMMKCMTEVESSITYEFKEGFTSFEYIGYGGGGWAGIYGKSGLFKIQWSDTLGGTYRDFKQLVVGPNKGKSTDLAVGEMTLDRPDQDSAGLAYFYSNKIPSAAKYLRLWFKGAGTGDSYYERLGEPERQGQRRRSRRWEAGAHHQAHRSHHQAEQHHRQAGRHHRGQARGRHHRALRNRRPLG